MASKRKSQTRYLMKWVLLLTIAWPLSLLVAIILSHLILNLFYQKETNLIVGLCIGACIGLVQWILLKKFRNPGPGWLIWSALGIGIPYGIIVLMEEAGMHAPIILHVDWLFSFCLFGFCGAIIGFFQARSISDERKAVLFFSLLSGIAWATSMALNSFFASGLLIAIITLPLPISLYPWESDRGIAEKIKP